MSIRPLIVVTGASKGIGLAVTEYLLVKFGVDVLSLSRSQTPELEKLSQSYPANLRIELCDVSSTDEAATSSALASCRRIDGLVLNAGAMAIARIDSDNSTVMAWKQLFDVNFFSLLHTVRSALPRLRESKGKIVFVSSGAATGGIAGWGAYNATKAAMNSFCRTLANEEPDVTCVALRPGRVDTAMQHNLRAEGAGDMSEAVHTEFVQAFSKGQLVKPEEPGHVIAALAVNASHDLTGQFVTWNAEELRKYQA
ncbi:NAD-P-binding protein [Hysterangium stoloniferum]|nr:NAD-P-binding protein [Hysterangium stoloniferum]